MAKNHRDEKYIPRYHPDYFPMQENPFRPLNKSYPCNGGNRVLLLTYVFTKPTREGGFNTVCTDFHQPSALCSIQ